ncbi:hypothetical protein Tel_05285 [Candidatus Tenderia electrophaga]|jgi:hypothetical protein|uniref:Dehydrogenase n=1 Tax=Candidatus Tenderia electrophaga TaxID=1748243 RepID=A0A0S2TBV5_9GAMM|nr:hypothetical protein Tel_05285 [Candidatus Tenderia electrophaga]
MKIYEDNFRRLMTLLPELDGEVQCCQGAGRRDGLSVDVLERHKYTTVIKLAQRLPLSFLAAAMPRMIVRIYHDAGVAEVLSYQRHYRFKPKYDYPNPEMCQVREKQRVNQFLGEWLDHCLAAGVSLRAVALG